MQIGTDMSSSQALSAYIGQQQTVANVRERDKESTEATRENNVQRGEVVNFSTEAKRLSTQDEQGTRRDAVNRGNESEFAQRQQQQTANPAQARAAAAQSPVQAATLYRDTFNI
jgi:hypothetical protein